MFFGGFCLCFGFMFWRFAPETVRKNSLNVRSVVFRVRFLLLWFFRRHRFSFFLFKRDSSGNNRTPPHTHLFCWFPFLFLCPAALVCFARFGRASRFLRFLRGAFLGPVRFCDSPGTCSEAPFLGTRGGMGFPVLLLLVCFFSPFVLCCGYTFLDARVGDLTE